MLTLSAKIRKERGKKVRAMRKKGILPAVLYGPKIPSSALEIDLKKFEKLFKEVGESSLLSLEIELGEKTAEKAGKEEKYLVLVHQIKRDPLTSTPIHVDFYQPNLEEEVTVMVPIVFEGEAPAVKELGGTLVKNISEVEVRARPQLLPKEIRVNTELLKNFGDHILIKDLELPAEVRISKGPLEIVALVSAPEKVEEELKKPIEEKIEEVEKVEEGKEAATEEEATEESKQ